MKAIVLTFDKYHPIAEHMIDCYQELWPDNPFVFRIPYQSYPEHLKQKYGDKIELIETKSDILSTMITLLSDLNDDEWVYWCMDDRYPVELNTNAINNFLVSLQEIDADGVTFVLSHKDNSIKYSYVFNKIKDNKGNTFYKKKHYGSIWNHQFIRVKVLRHFFKHMPKSINNAKDMDYYLIKESILPQGFKLLVTTTSFAKYGESSTRGMMTKNCYQSMIIKRIQPPKQFKITDSRIIQNNDDNSVNQFAWRVKDIVKSIFNL